MPLNIEGYEAKITQAVKNFWLVRQKNGVRSGKTLDGFIDLISWVVHNSGLPEAVVLTGNRDAQLPGYFRPTKSWDVVVLNRGTLIAAIELKSIADSFSKNSNNRNEEALGSGVDIKEAIAEEAFEGLARLFTGYLILVEECLETSRSVQIQLRHFRAMPEFMADPEKRDSKYVRQNNGIFPPIDGVSYIKRFDILCRRLMQKNLYTAAAVITSPSPDRDIHDGSYNDVSPDTSIKALVAALAGHVEAISMIQSH